MDEFKFKYSANEIASANLTDIVADFNKNKANQIQTYLSSPEHEINVLYRLDTNDFYTINDIRTELAPSKIIDCLSGILDQAELDGIKGCNEFGVWLHGNTDGFPNINKLSGHTHTQGHVFSKDKCQVYTVIVPISVTEEITDTIWATWIDDIEEKVPKAPNRLLPKSSSPFSTNKASSSFEEKFRIWNTQVRNLRGWWDHLRDQSPNEELKLLFPNKDEKLIIDFNATNWLHGVEHIKNNVYLVVLFDAYQRN